MASASPFARQTDSSGTMASHAMLEYLAGLELKNVLSGNLEQYGAAIPTHEDHFAGDIAGAATNLRLSPRPFYSVTPGDPQQ